MARQGRDHELVCLLDERAAQRFDLNAPNVRPVTVPLSASPTEAAADGSSRSLADMLRLSAATHRIGADVFYSPTVYTYFPLPPRQRAVVTIHDTIVERFPQLTIPARLPRLFWKAKVRLALTQTRLVLTDSQHSADDITELLGVPRTRIRVADLAPAAAYRDVPDAHRGRELARRAGVPDDRGWITYVGGLNPHKYVDRIVAAHGRVAAGHPAPPHLLLVGPSDDVFHGAHEEIRRGIEAAGTSGLVHFLGFVPDDDLRHLHAAALALLLPSATEGFGLPAVEAAACGCPVIATTASPLPTLLAGGGIFVPPGDVDAIERGIRVLLHSPGTRSSMGTTARERALSLTWDASARSVLAALREAAA